MTFPNITLELSPSSVFEDGTTNLVYTFTRTGITTSALTVNYSITGTADSSDYTGATPGTGKTITFAAGASTATLTIDPTVDTLIESDETVTLTLLPFSGTIANTISESASGGFGVTEKLYYISSTGGSFSLNYEMYSVPDKAEIFVNNVLTTRTNGFVSGSGSLNLNSVTLQTGDQVKVVITGNDPGTVWDYNVYYSGGIVPTTYTVGTTGAVTGTILDDDATITLAVSPTSVLEDATNNLVYTFTRTGYTASALTVNYSITGTADSSDYTGATPGTGKTITFAAGASTATLTIDPTADTTIESNETVGLTLVAGTGYTVGTTGAVTGTIANDDPTITLALSPSSVLEDGTTNLVYTFTRTGITTNALTVNYSITGTADSSDYTGATPGTGKTITFAAGATTATLTIDPTADTTIESDETVALTLVAGTGYTVGTTGAVTGTIANDDPTITLAVSPSSVLEDGTTNLVYTFTRTGITTNALTVNYSITGTANNSDYTGATPGTGKTITFAAGASTATLTIDPTADTTFESDETVGLTLVAGTGYTVGTTGAVTGTIANDDARITLAVSRSSVLEDGTTNLVYTFTRTGITTNALTVNYSITGTANNSDYTGATPGTGKTITFAAGASTATLTIDPTADTTFESDETVGLTLVAGTGYTVGTTGAVTGTIANDDARITLAVSRSSVLEDGTTNLVYTFTRTGITTNALTVNYSITGTADSSDYTGATPGTGKTITFAAGATTATLTIDPTADNIVESDETVGLTLVAGTGYTVGTTGAVTGTIANDDARITLAVSPSSVFENGTTNLVYTFTRTGYTANALTVNYSITGTADSSDYTGATPGTGKTITFDAGASTATLTIDPTADTTIESDETVALTLVAGTGYTVGTTGAVTGTIANDDASITLALSPSSVLEDGTTNLVYTFTRSGYTANALTVNYSITGTADSSDYTGATPGTGKTITFAAGATTATLTIDPTADTIGEFNETVSLTLVSGTDYTVGTTGTVTGTITNDDALFSSSFDLVLLQDLSGSFGDDIATVRTLVPNLIAGINSLQPNTPIGISSFIDKPITPFGASGDYVYRTDQALTTNSTTIQNIYNGLTIRDGNDTPEAQLEALLQVAVRPTEIGFNTGTKRVVVLFTDAAYHVAGDGAVAGITTPNNLNAILDGTPPGTGEDYPGVLSVKQSLINANIFPIFAVTSDQISTYQSLISQLGVAGSVVQLSSDSSNIINVIQQGLSNLFLANINAPIGGLITTEAGTTNSFTVTLSTQPSANVTIGLQVSDSTEGTLSTNSLVFTPTNWNVAQTVTVTGIDDPEVANLLDGDQTYQIITAPLVSTDINYNGVNPVDVTVINRDNDATITLAISPSSVFEDATNNLVYTFTRTGDTTSALTVNYSITGTADSSDYTGATPGTGKTITFAAGASTATLTIDPTADTTTESDETVGLTLVAGTGYTVGTTGEVTGTIANDDASITLAVSPSSVLEDGTTNLVYTFTRTGYTANALTVNYSITGTADSRDYTGATPGTGKTITFDAGASTATLTIDPTADTTFESDETVGLTLVAGTGYTVETTGPVTGNINDDNDRPILSSSQFNFIGVEGLNNEAVIVINLIGANGQRVTSKDDITFNYTTSPTGAVSAIEDVDYTKSSGTVTILAGSPAGIIYIPILNDNINEPDESFLLTLSNPTNATIDTGLTDDGIEVVITDTLPSAVTRILPNLVENLTLTGTGNINGTGNTGNNFITGNSGNNILAGGLGNDTLIGGLGNDQYQFYGVFNTLGVDTINFQAGQISLGQNRDNIALSKATFSAITNAVGQALTDFGVVLNDNSVGASNARIVYSQGTGSLFYNSNGSTPGGESMFAVLSDRTITLVSSDFTLIA